MRTQVCVRLVSQAQLMHMDTEASVPGPEEMPWILSVTGTEGRGWA